MNNNYIDAGKLRQISFIIILLLLGYLLFIELKNFVPAFLGALTFYVVMRKSMFRMVYVRKIKPGLAATILMVTSFIVIMVPIWMTVNMMSPRISSAIENSGEVIEKVKIFIRDVESQTNVNLGGENNLNKLSSFLATTIPNVLGATFNTIASIAMMYFMLYFMLVNGRKMEKVMSSFVPMNDENTNKVGKEVNNIVISNAIAIPLIAFLQGIVGLIGYYLLGVKEPMFWFVVTCFTAMLPIVGAALAYVPASILFFVDNNTWKGIGMLAYGFGIIGLVDNVFRITLQRKIGDIHPLVTILGVIAGLNLFGFIGLIFGPLLISLFLLLTKIYSLEFIQKQPITGS
ncbi:MAG: AI-2E family transporter [Chitinophagaceae bacterium]